MSRLTREHRPPPYGEINREGASTRLQEYTFECLDSYSGLHVRKSFRVLVHSAAAGSAKQFGASPHFLGAFIAGMKVRYPDSFCFDDLPEGSRPQHLPKNEPILWELPVWVVR